MKQLTILILVMLLGFSTNAKEIKIRPFNEADLPQKALSISYKKNGQIKELVMSQWVDRIKTKDGMVYRKYQQGYSYNKKKGFLKVFNLEGKLLNKKWSKKIDGGITKEELLIAYDLFKKNKDVHEHMQKTNLAITLHGGFNYEDDKKCKPGNRCVHIFAATAENAILAHSIIRLSDAKVVYPEYDMESNSKITHVKGM